MEFKNAIFSILIVGLIITGSGIILANWATQYSSGVSSDLEDLVRTSEISTEAETQKGKINPQSGEASSDFETETFRGGYGILTNIYASLRLVYGDEGMIDSVADRFGIPKYIWQTIVIMILTAITFTLIAIIFRRARSTT